MVSTADMARLWRVRYWERYPDRDPNRTLTEMLYDVPFFGFTMTKMKKAQDDLCVLPEDLDDYLKPAYGTGATAQSFMNSSSAHGNRKLQADHHTNQTRLESRYVSPLIEYYPHMHPPRTGYPIFGMILEGIAYGVLSLHYGMWV
jgi:hypothetical protein